MLVSSYWQDTSVVREKWCLIYISGKTNIQHGHQAGRHITGDVAFKIVRIKLAHPPPIFLEGEKWKCFETSTKIMNVISKPARQALVGWGDQEEQGLSVNGVKPAGKLPLKMPINSESSCFTSYPIIRSNYKMSPNHRSRNSWIHMYILYIYIYFYIHTYTNILVSLGCVPLRATVERVSLPKNVRILGAHWHPERGPHPIPQQKIESCPY